MCIFPLFWSVLLASISYIYIYLVVSSFYVLPDLFLCIFGYN